MSSSVPESSGNRLAKDGAIYPKGGYSRTPSSDSHHGLAPGQGYPSKRSRGNRSTAPNDSDASSSLALAKPSNATQLTSLASALDPPSHASALTFGETQLSTGPSGTQPLKFVLNGWLPPSLVKSGERLSPPVYDFFTPSSKASDFGEIFIDPSPPATTIVSAVQSSDDHRADRPLSTTSTEPQPRPLSMALLHVAGAGPSSTPLFDTKSRTAKSHDGAGYLLNFTPEDGWPDFLDGVPHHPKLYLGRDSEGSFDFATYTAPSTAQGSLASQVVLAIHRKATDDGDYRLEALPIFPCDSHTDQLDSRQSIQDRNQKSFVIAMWMEKERLRRQKGSSRSAFGVSESQSEYSDPFAPISDRRLEMSWSNQFNEPRSIALELEIMESKVPVEELKGTQIEDLGDDRFVHTSHSFDMRRDLWPVYAQQPSPSVFTAPSITISSPELRSIRLL